MTNNQHWHSVDIRELPTALCPGMIEKHPSLAVIIMHDHHRASTSVRRLLRFFRRFGSARMRIDIIRLAPRIADMLINYIISSICEDLNQVLKPQAGSVRPSTEIYAPFMNSLGQF